MTTVAVFADPPREGLVLPHLVETSPLSADEAALLYAALLKDALRAVTNSGGELLVNYRPDDLIPERFHGEQSAEAEVRTLAADALREDELDDTRFEVQVGSTVAARAGNTVTHLLRREQVTSAAVVPANAAMLTRTEIDGAAMKLRRNEMVLGPAPGGRVYFAGFTEPIDFDGAYEPPELETLTDRGVGADLDVGYMAMLPVVETGTDLASLVSMVSARRSAGRIVPQHAAEVLDSFGLRVVETDGDRVLER